MIRDQRFGKETVIRRAIYNFRSIKDKLVELEKIQVQKNLDIGTMETMKKLKGNRLEEMHIDI